MYGHLRTSATAFTPWKPSVQVRHRPLEGPGQRPKLNVRSWRWSVGPRLGGLTRRTSADPGEHARDQSLTRRSCADVDGRRAWTLTPWRSRVSTHGESESSGVDAARAR